MASEWVGGWQNLKVRICQKRKQTLDASIKGTCLVWFAPLDSAKEFSVPRQPGREASAIDIEDSGT